MFNARMDQQIAEARSVANGPNAMDCVSIDFEQSVAVFMDSAGYKNKAIWMFSDDYNRFTWIFV